MPRPGSDDVHLITGFPSFAARKLLELILTEHPKAFVYVVIMPKLQSAADVALDALVPSQRARVGLLEGDAAAMDLGLSGAEFRQLSYELDYVHHLAHASYVGVDRDYATALNMIGAAEIVELAKAMGSLKCLAFHSTARVSGKRTGVVYEDELDVGQSFRSVIEETRMRGEKIARAAMKRLPIVVLRPTTVVGDSGTGEMWGPGEVGRFGGPYLLMLLIMAAPQDVALPLPGGGDAAINIVPVDFVVRAALSIAQNPNAIGKTFHLADARPPSCRRLVELVAHAAGRRAPSGSINTSVTRALMRAPGIERFMRSPRELLDQLTTNVRYDARNTQRALAGTGIECPSLESYVDQLVQRVQEHQRQRELRKLEGDEPAERMPMDEWDLGG